MHVRLVIGQPFERWHIAFLADEIGHFWHVFNHGASAVAIATETRVIEVHTEITVMQSGWNVNRADAFAAHIAHALFPVVITLANAMKARLASVAAVIALREETHTFSL